MGDPALTPNFPRYYVKSSTIRDGFTGDQTNTIKALGEYVIEGYVTDGSGNKLEDFNGVIYTTIFDKPRKVKTITSVNKIFEVRSNIIYRGKATVTNGVFTINFIAPKDINYEYGQGKISYYAENGQTDGAGVDTAVAIGGYSDNPRVEYDSPIVKAYIKDSLFRNGGLTGSNTALFAIIEDETGINISGNSIGHDLTAVLDGDVSNPYIMNDYYETAPNTYKKGFLYFPVENIPEGRHRFTIKAWDVNNNSGEGYVDFVVKDGQILAIQELGNYPNPFRDKTNFVFEHNRPDENLKAEVNIYNTTGLLVRKLNKDFISTGSRSNEISWDGTDNNGTKLTPGLYIYKMNLMTETGIESAANQKLIILP
ncbi:MAG: T9SS type A sorting domain-containing protein [Candidatus Kuenenia stuttgartiensis]|nr:T9SS type A sorting domain-containing protein [Candidatus Kuenenia stuttgartiensis]